MSSTAGSWTFGEVHLRSFPAAQRPTVSPESVDRAAILARRENEATADIPWHKRAQRRLAKESAAAQAEQEAQAEEARRREAAAQEQAMFDEDWQQLLANDPERVLAALEQAFCRQRRRLYGITDGGGAIYRTGPQGGASSLVLGGYQAGLAGSPSGRYLAFSRRSLFILDLRNHRLRRVTHGPEDFNPSWSPNGQTILYIHASNPTTGVATAEMAMLDVRTGRSTLLPWTRGARLTQPAFIP